MFNVSNDETYNWRRLCSLQNLLGDAGWTDASCAASGGLQPAFLPPARPLELADVFEALRNRFQATPHDAYERRNPGEPWRPVAVLRTALAHGARHGRARRGWLAHCSCRGAAGCWRCPGVAGAPSA